MTQTELNRILQAIDAYTKEVTKTPDAARAALENEGIYDKHGKLTQQYGGAAVS
jgi:hypothetical protein